ncbi:type IV pilin-like G/H family protein [Romeria aff. gracilis LEGE 07310]|uniref:Type IV pilin-like G/H family protein n=1 Tax=Vasconcelosia minhoensis LEGE 07310 TaxID=915328 RepID=A0A8J7DDF7_9CYAN|nr:type IV pilin-like G/H family protein [Romeria gracilis]MBE9078728.1 type IV pilin-like G/H family protein [Romeria aff. gracilis LEGE 07310]
MKTELKAKLLQHFSKKNKSGGFTLIELLVVIIIIGILSAIALPSFLNQANKAKQSEGKTYVGSMNRAQQAYFLENGAFTDSVDTLGLGVNTRTNNYTYAIPTDAADLATQALNGATPTSAALKSYAGGVKLGTATGGNATTLAVLCEADTAGTTQPTATFPTDGDPSCADDWTNLSNPAAAAAAEPAAEPAADPAP